VIALADQWRAMGIRSYLIEGVSGTGKTSVCKKLQRRGSHAINGDTELAKQTEWNSLCDCIKRKKSLRKTAS
jgi:broad-specificity NMP kinase